MRAKKALQGKEIMGPATGPIRIGFAKVPALPTTPTSGTMMPTPPITNTMMPPHPGMIAPIPNTNTMIPTMTPPSAAIATSMSRPDYHNFDPMTMAATAVDSTENLKSASTFGGWSTTSSSPTTPFNHTTTTTSHPNGGGCTNGGEGYQQQQMMMYMMAEMMGNGSTNIYAAIASERQLLMSELGGTEDENDGPLFDEMHMPLSYFANIPAAPELGQSRRIDIGRLRDIRKRLDTGYVPTKELEVIALECLDEIIELCSDHIGNTVIQRLFERCSEVTKSRMLDVVAPYLASIGIHKNGTWAAQKIIDTGRLPAQINRICASIKPYVPALLLDQFGNYVVQCCLGLGPERNQFIFDAIVDNCWEIAQGRFGARAVRATLESPHVTKRQQKYVAATIIQHALVLATNANGALLLIWLLDTSGIPGRYRVLAPRLTPHLTRLCTHKLASLTVLKIINQRHEPDARALILDALIFNYNNNNHDQQQHPVVIDEVLKDQVHGVNLIQKILSSSYVELRERQRIAERMKQVLNKLKLQHVQGYKRLMEEINMVMGDSNPGASLGALPGLVPPSFAMNPEVAAAFHAKYLAAAAAAVQAATSTTTTATATAGIVEGNANTGNAGTTLSSSSTLITTSSPVPEPRTSMDQPQQVVVVGDNNELVASPTVTTTETTTTATTTAM
ncbi:armadillo-type protein [Phascolomyces articulosus]|uniref:Armadillo-type protein n=1 Tax=Phascolomyces articulosus TaxID=60185 RepID=A0AAD5PCR3_9FUNG|nr:armadillo-type protein [Phascolomyces articulosus]